MPLPWLPSHLRLIARNKLANWRNISNTNSTVCLSRELAPGADPQLRRLMIGVTVARRLRDSIDTDSGTRVCSQPVTPDIYLLFMDDMARRGGPRPPDAQPVAEPTSAYKPITWSSRK